MPVTPLAGKLGDASFLINVPRLVAGYLVQKIPYLRELGLTAVELMPVLEPEGGV